MGSGEPQQKEIIIFIKCSLVEWSGVGTPMKCAKVKKNRLRETYRNNDKYGKTEVDGKPKR